jgi:hypothetical protein
MSFFLQIARDLTSPSENFDVTHVKGPSDKSDDWSSIGSQGTMGGLLVAGFVSYIYRRNKMN